MLRLYWPNEKGPLDPQRIVEMSAREKVLILRNRAGSQTTAMEKPIIPRSSNLTCSSRSNGSFMPAAPRSPRRA